MHVSVYFTTILLNVVPTLCCLGGFPVVFRYLLQSRMKNIWKYCRAHIEPSSTICTGGNRSQCADLSWTTW